MRSDILLTLDMAEDSVTTQWRTRAVGPVEGTIGCKAVSYLACCPTLKMEPLFPNRQACRKDVCIGAHLGYQFSLILYPFTLNQL
jgi:hypothetical protein